MAKQIWKPGNMIYPLPAVMVSITDGEGNDNIITVAWTGTVCTNPAMAYISVRPSRYSYDMIRKTGEFVINLTTENMARATDWCGIRSGKDYNKFAESELTPVPSEKIAAPYIEESPLCIECKVKEIVDLGSHDMFISEVVNVIADEQFINPENGAFDLEKARLLVYSHGHYYGIGKEIGKFGWSVQKKKKKK